MNNTCFAGLRSVVTCVVVDWEVLWVHPVMMEALVFHPVDFTREFKTGSPQIAIQSQKTPYADFPAGLVRFHSFQPKLHLYPPHSPLQPPCMLLHHFTLICLPHIFKSLFIGIYRGFHHFPYKGRGVFPLLLAMLPIYGGELAQFPMSLLLFPDMH